ncbi:MAG: hypothetical protein EA361_11415 [Bacteroidetes bacterium]|nr:MAG: hypothetical protein EA361_11415 [Bacteroidota bacterium]
MKKTLLFILFLISFHHLSFGAFHVVSNQNGTERDFRSIQSAIEQAAPYDTIFVKGSPVNYGNVLLEKPLVLIGEGFSDEFYVGHTAKITRILFTANPYRRTISSGSVIMGFEFPYFPGQRPNIITVANERMNIENITLERNWLWFVEVVGNAENWVFRNNIIRGWIKGGSTGGNETQGASGFVLQNNIINSLMGFHRGEVYIENNVILGRLKDISGAVVQNNIFTREEYIMEEVYGSRFENNVASANLIGIEQCYGNPSGFESTYLCEGANNTGKGNRVGVDPEFVMWPGDDIMGGTAFKLSESSPGRGNRTNGNQAGIFGGKYPFPASVFKNPEIDDPFPSFVTSIY